MDEDLLIAAFDALAAVLGILVGAHHDLAISALPADPRERLRWVRTLQQMGRDAEVLAEAGVVLLRRLDELRRTGLSDGG